MTSSGLCVRLTTSPCLTHVTGRAGFTPMPCSQTPCPPGQPAHVPGLSVWEQDTARAPASASPHQAPSRKAHSRAALDGEAMLTTHTERPAGLNVLWSKGKNRAEQGRHWGSGRLLGPGS